MVSRLMSGVALAVLLGLTPVSAQDQGGQQGGGQQAPAAGAQQQTGGEGAPEILPNQQGGGKAQTGQQQMDEQGSQPQQGQARQRKQSDDNADTAGGDQPAAGEDQNRRQTGAEAGSDQKQAEEGKAGDRKRTQGARAEISDRDRTAIRDAVGRDRAKRVRVDFDLNVGFVVPGSVAVYPLPQRIVSVVPAYEGYSYFVTADGTIVIVDPDTLAIVYVIPA